MKASGDALPPDYGEWLASLKQRIQSARSWAILAAHGEQICLYHSIGCDILERKSQQGWGARVINRRWIDLREAFPGMKGLSARNLKYMAVFAEKCPDIRVRQQAAAQFPWFYVVRALPEPLDRSLPSIEEIEAELLRELEGDV
ncbi:MAG: DUF1016 domain-containing protein [Acaryochloris sp. RU_4_1]|nr:DUF1016 domain-containing protein [Acaryochloris sp. RU_4_1]